MGHCSRVARTLGQLSVGDLDHTDERSGGATAGQESGMTACTVDDIARALLDKLGPIDAMKLEKLVYYVQAWHVAIYDDPAFDEPIEAWRDGPVVDRLYQQHRQRRTVSSWPSGDAGRLGDTENTVVKAIVGVYGDLSGDDLSQLTHSEGPWVSARRGYEPHERSRQVITHSALRAYYRGKKLAGRLPTDLAVGGFHYGLVGRVDSDEVRQIVRSAKADITGRVDATARRDLLVPVVRDVSDEPLTIRPSRSRPAR